MSNLPIAYDFHGDVPFEVPFREIAAKDIHIYLDLDTRTGKNGCGQACAHCWFVNYEKAFNKSFDMIEGQKIKTALDQFGYKVFARYTDSFAQNGNFMRIYGPVHNREFRQEQDHQPTATMTKGDAWTSGAPLMQDNYLQLLDLARDSGYGTVSITFHGLIDENINLRPENQYPIKGVFSGAQLEKVAARIATYNEAQSPENKFRLNIGITLGRHNNSLEHLVRYAHYFNKMKVATVRFNNFTDHGGRHPHLPMNAAEIAQAYRDIKWLHENIQLDFQLAVSEDFGTDGIEVMEFPSHVGWCRAGRQLFTVIPSGVKVLNETAITKTEAIGDIVACVNIFEPHLGLLIRETVHGRASYHLKFDEVAIENFTRQRIDGTYKNGCFAKEMLQEKPLQLTTLTKAALRRMQVIEEVMV